MKWLVIVAIGVVVAACAQAEALGDVIQEGVAAARGAVCAEAVSRPLE